MARNRAKFYIERLRNKGWKEGEIQKICNITAKRYSWISLPGAIPQNIEVKRLRSMLKRPTLESIETVRSVWSGVRGEPHENGTSVSTFTPKQREVIKMLATSKSRGNDAIMLDRVEASVASRLARKGFVRIEEARAGKSTFKRYGLTDMGFDSSKSL
jgi:hypothetical protein